MNDIKLARAVARRRARAVDCYTRLQAGDLSPRARRWCEAYLSVSENRHAYDAIDELRRAMRHAAQAGNVKKETHVEGRTRIVGWMKLPAGIAGLLIGSMFALWILSRPTLETHIAEWDKRMLEDGSVVNVGPQTSLRVSMDERRRRVRLDRGEAVFDVAKDPTRPFIVSTEVANVTAVGTRFVVTVHAGEVITVVEGKVAVTLRGAGAGASRMLLPGDQVRIERGRLVGVATVDAERELALATGRLELNGETVAVAVAEFNRRNRLQIEVGPPLGRLRLGWGSFELNDPEAFAATLERGGFAVIVRERPGVLRLEPTPLFRPRTSPQ